MKMRLHCNLGQAVEWVVLIHKERREGFNRAFQKKCRVSKIAKLYRFSAVNPKCKIWWHLNAWEALQTGRKVTRTLYAQSQFNMWERGKPRIRVLGAQTQQGIIKKNELSRYTGRFNATQKLIEDRLIVEVNLNVANTKNYRVPSGSILGDAISSNPTYPAYDANGEIAKYQNINNPLLYVELDKELTNITRVIGNISPSFKIIKGLVYKLNFGVDNSNGTRDVVALPNAVPLRDGRLETWTTNKKNTLIENYLTYTASKDNHDFSVLAGHSYQKFFEQGRNTSINRFPISPVDPFYNGDGKKINTGG